MEVKHYHFASRTHLGGYIEIPLDVVDFDNLGIHPLCAAIWRGGRHLDGNATVELSCLALHIWLAGNILGGQPFCLRDGKRGSPSLRCICW